MRGREIAEMASGGEITSQEAEEMFRELHGGKGEIVAFNPKKNRFNAIVEWKNYTFNHERAYDHYLDRKDLEEGVKHVIGKIAFGVTGIVDGALEGTVYMASEIAETASFAVSRTINRVRSGWRRGFNDVG